MSVDFNVWILLFEHTPPAMRWVLGILTCGLFYLAQRLYLAHKNRVDKLESVINARMLQTDHNITALRLHIDKKDTNLHEKIDTLTLSILNNRG